jgi:hypothetical protein
MEMSGKIHLNFTLNEIALLEEILDCFKVGYGGSKISNFYKDELKLADSILKEIKNEN